MPRYFLYSLFLHISLLLVLLVQFQPFEKTKKVNYRKFSVNIATKRNNDKKTLPVQTEEIKRPLAPQKVEKKESPKENKTEIETTEKQKLKAEKEKPQKTKVEKKETKKSTQPIINKTKKEKKKEIKKSAQWTKAKKERKKEYIKHKKQKDIFSKLIDHKTDNVKDINVKVANLVDDDLAIIKEQISRYWIKTPCPDNIKVELEIVVNSNCDIIGRNINMQKYAYSPQVMACANSAFRATQQCEKLNLEIKKCQELNGKIILLSFNLYNDH